MSAKTSLRPRHLGDFAVTPRMLLITAWALPVGVASGFAASGLLHLIGLVTNLDVAGRGQVRPVRGRPPR